MRSAKADTFAADDNLYEMLRKRCAESTIACVFVDESQFLSKEQVWELARSVDDFKVPIMCYGLRTDCMLPGIEPWRQPAVGRC